MPPKSTKKSTSANTPSKGDSWDRISSILPTIITVIGSIIVAYIGLLGIRTQVAGPGRATETATTHVAATSTLESTLTTQVATTPSSNTVQSSSAPTLTLSTTALPELPIPTVTMSSTSTTTIMMSPIPIPLATAGLNPVIIDKYGNKHEFRDGTFTFLIGDIRKDFLLFNNAPVSEPSLVQVDGFKVIGRNGNVITLQLTLLPEGRTIERPLAQSWEAPNVEVIEAETNKRFTIALLDIQEVKFQRMPAIKMTYPRSGNSVGCKEEIEGSYSSDIKETIWPIVQYGEQYFPQKAAAKASSEWLATVFFGDCENLNADKDKTFQLIIVTASDQANAEFEKFLTNEPTIQNRAMNSLPQGIKEHARIQVNRR